MARQHEQLNISLDENNLEKSAQAILDVIRPQWQTDNIKFKHFTEGITNKLIGCYEADKGFGCDVVLIRIYGANTDLIIDRDTEKNNIIFLSEHGLCPPLYAEFNNGVAYGFSPGQTLDPESVRRYRVQIAKEMVKLHSLKPKSGSPPSAGLFPKLEKWLAIAPTGYDQPEKNERFKKNVGSIERLMKEYEELKKTIESLNAPAVMSHNDLLLKNLVYDAATDKISLIDHEYAMFNYQPYDIGNHFCEYAGVDEVDFSRYPNKEYQLMWLRTYLEEWNKQNEIKSAVTDEEVYKLYTQVNKCALAAHFFWGVWALIQSKYSTIDFDYLDYAIMKLNEYFARKEEFLAL
ncbi:ethanolamine kinase 1-like [Mytilus galloprovincialis]